MGLWVLRISVFACFSLSWESLYFCASLTKQWWELQQGIALSRGDGAVGRRCPKAHAKAELDLSGSWPCLGDLGLIPD